MWKQKRVVPQDWCSKWRKMSLGTLENHYLIKREIKICCQYMLCIFCSTPWLHNFDILMCVTEVENLQLSQFCRQILRRTFIMFQICFIIFMYHTIYMFQLSFLKKKPNFLYMYFLLIVCLMYCFFALACVYGMLHSLSCSFTSTSLLTKQFCHNNIQHRTDSAWKMEWQFMPVHADDLLKGHTKKRLGQPEAARGLEITPDVLEYC